MWNVIGGFVLSSITEVFVKEIVKEIKKPGKPLAPPQEAPVKCLKHTKGQVMVLDWLPAEEDASPPSKKAGKPRQRAVGKRKSPQRPTSSQRHE